MQGGNLVASVIAVQTLEGKFFPAFTASRGNMPHLFT
jgi:hypothetical protein